MCARVCAPAEDGLSSHTLLVSGVRRLQSPSEWTDDTEEGLSPPDRPGPGDLVLRPLDRPLPFDLPATDSTNTPHKDTAVFSI